MPELPTDLTYGKVTGRFLTAVGDGPDAGTLPDAAVPTGLTVKFTPKTATFKTTSPSATVVSRPITCTIDSEGNLLDPMNVQGVWLIAGLYSVTYSGGSDFVLPAHEVEVTTAHTALAPLDLTVAMPPGPVLTPTQYTDLNGRVTVLENTTGGGGGEGGVTDHGLLTGLTDDDHVQYHTDARGDARYYTKTANDALLTGKAATVHAHAIADVTGLQGALDGKQAAGSYAPATHTHTTAQVTGLDTALSGKASTAHTHPASDLTATGTRDATTFLRGDNTWATPAGGGGGTSWTMARSAQFRCLPGWFAISRDNSMACAADTAYLFPVDAAGAWAPSEIDVRVLTAGAGSVYVWVYAADVNTGLPTGSALLSTGAFDVSTLGQKAVTGLSTNLPAGSYVVVLRSSVAVTFGGVGCAVGFINFANGQSLANGVPTVSGITATTAPAASAFASPTATGGNNVPVNVIHWK